MAFLLVLLFPTAASADADADARNLARDLVEISYIESERRKPSVPDDFADEALIFSREQVAAATPAMRAKAERIATQIRNAPRRTPWLKGWPDPWTVRKDMAEASKGESDLVIAARQAGRFLMFDLAMNRLGGTVFNDRLPQDVQRLQIAYLVHYWDLRDRQQKTFEKSCPRFGPCRRRTFHQISTDYTHDIEPARDAAARYLPASLHEQFIDITAPRGTRTPPRAAPKPEPQTTGEKFWPSLSFIIFVGLGLLLLFAFIRFLAQGAGKRATSTAYGSARFAPPETGMPKPERLYQGTFFGFSYQPDPKMKDKAAPILSARENHTLIVAPSRTGKGTRVIVPTLLLYTPSLITLDPKGENAAQTARYRRDQLGHKVHIVNPWGVHAALYESYGFSPATINPLDVLDRDDPSVAATATAIAKTICIRPGDSNTIWQNQAAALLTALLLWVTDEPGEIKTLSRIADLVSGGSLGEDLRKTIIPRMIASSSFEGAMRKAIGQVGNLADETYSGIIFNLTEALQFLIDPLLVRATNHSSFDPADLTRPDTTVYLVIPDQQLQTQAVWVKLLFASVVSTFKLHRPASKDVRSMFLLDEFPALGRMDSFANDIAIAGGAGLDITIAIQNLGQLKANYGDSAETIISNCGWKWFCNVQDLATAEYVSKLLGTKTQPTQTETFGQNNTSVAYGETARPLRTPDEVQTEGKQFAYVIRPGASPYLVETCDHWELKARFDFLTKRDPLYPLPDLDAVDDNPDRSKLASVVIDFWRKFSKPRVSPASTSPRMTPVSPLPTPPLPSPPKAQPEPPPRVEAMPAPVKPYDRRDALRELDLEDPVTFDEIVTAYDMLQLERLPENEEGERIRQRRDRAFKFLSPPKSGDWDL